MLTERTSRENRIRPSRVTPSPPANPHLKVLQRGFPQPVPILSLVDSIGRRIANASRIISPYAQTTSSVSSNPMTKAPPEKPHLSVRLPVLQGLTVIDS